MHDLTRELSFLTPLSTTKNKKILKTTLFSVLYHIYRTKAGILFEYVFSPFFFKLVYLNIIATLHSCWGKLQLKCAIGCKAPSDSLHQNYVLRSRVILFANLFNSVETHLDLSDSTCSNLKKTCQKMNSLNFKFLTVEYCLIGMKRYLNKRSLNSHFCSIR